MEANDGVQVNIKYKDRLFRFIFGAEENKKYLLSLYNAVNKSDYADEDAFEITTLEDVIYIKMKNDISFLFDSELNLYEHQSTFNPNMPLRGLMYFSDLYRQYLSARKRDLYNSSLVKVPSPKYLVFYNGDREMSDQKILKLSDAFEQEDSSGMYEWSAVMLNINAGHNEELMERCTALRQYAMYVAKVKEYSRTMPIRAAVDKAVDEAIRENYLDGFFKNHREGVVNTSLTEFNEAEFVANRREEGRIEGRAAGRKEAAEQFAMRLIRRGEADEDIAELAGCSVEEVAKLREGLLETV